MLLGPKYKICKRLGASVFEKCQTQKFQLAEARSPRKVARRRGGSDFGVQLLEKQKARFTYGLSESQFSRYVHEAIGMKGKDSIIGLLTRLESRLDNVVYRAGLVKTRRAARQMVGHGHIMVNGRRVNVPSFKVEKGMTVSVRPESRDSALFINRTAGAAETKAPQWMKFDDQGFAAQIEADPAIGEGEAPFSASVIIQFYSR